MIYHDERLALFIDGANLQSSARSLRLDIDYRRLRKEFMRRGKLVRCYYYMAVSESYELSPLRPLIDWLEHNGFAIVKRPAKEYVDGLGRRKIKTSIDVELAVDALELASRFDHAILFSGNGDLTPLVQALQRMGVRVSVCSTIQSQSAMASDDLRRQADAFIELEELRALIEKSDSD